MTAIIKECPVCHEPFRTWPKRNQTYCCSDCHNFYKRKNHLVYTTCDNCNMQFYKYEKDIERSNKHFCSVECHHSFRKKGKHGSLSVLQR